MLFKEFAQKLAIVLKAGSNTSAFTRSLFEEIIPEDRLDVLDEYKASSYKAFYNGSSPINRISSKINGFADSFLFADYIDRQEDAAVEKLCDIFYDDLPGIDTSNADKLIGELFSSIITEAAAQNKKSAPKDAKPAKPDNTGFGILNGDVLPELTPENASKVFILSREIADTLAEEEVADANPFSKYMDEATSYFSTKKTLLYAEKPHPFYELYVCNDIRYRKFRVTGHRDSREEKTICDATIPILEAESPYIIIEGTGGIGKSMFLTHLFLSATDSISENGKIPLLLSLKDYKDDVCGIIDFIWKSAREFDPDITQNSIINALRENKIVLLLDGLDEIQSSTRDGFNQDLDAFIKSYPGNSIIMTSRPIYSFLNYSKFSLYDIQPLSKAQAIELVQKLEFWDTEAKRNFLTALDQELYSSHYQFASNPLLLTIMLMTYSSFGEVPAKMHVFYSKAYETMARLHDASKGSFKRSLHTGLTPEEFSKYFAQFCARTYEKEILEFDFRSFSYYMEKVINTAAADHRNIAPRDFLLDLTDNLCIMYQEGEKYYFIHRSFQEYFAAVHLASEYDEKFKDIGDFFEHMEHRSYSDKTFEMLCDMIPEKIERFIFFPFLEELFTGCSEKVDGYWEFLERIYPTLYYEEGDTGDSCSNEASSFIYRTIVEQKSLEEPLYSDDHEWPSQIYNLPTRNWVEAFSEFLDSWALDEYLNPDDIPETELDRTCIVDKDELPYRYTDYFGEPDSTGVTIEISVHTLRNNPSLYATLRKHMEQEDFPLFKEFQNVNEYYNYLKDKNQRRTKSRGLFPD